MVRGAGEGIGSGQLGHVLHPGGTGWDMCDMSQCVPKYAVHVPPRCFDVCGGVVVSPRWSSVPRSPSRSRDPPPETRPAEIDWVPLVRPLKRVKTCTTFI